MAGPVLAILFGFAFTLATCYAAGRILLTRLRIDLYAGESVLFAFVSGSACVSLAVFTLLATGIAYTGIFLAIGVAAIAMSLREKQPDRVSLPPLPSFWKWIFLLVFCAYTVLYWSQAMGPEYSPDGSTYHLGYVARYLRQHGFGWITTSVYANLSQGLEMLFLFAFAFGRHSAAAMVHFAFFVTLVLAMVTYGRRFNFPRGGIFAALLIYTSPVFGFDGTTAYVDVAAACVVFFAFYALQIWELQRDNGLLILAGLLSGFAYAIKYTAGIAVIYAVGFVLWKSRSLRRAAIVCATSAILISPWMIKNWIVVGNPVSPLMNRWFPNPYVSVAFEQAYIALMTHAAGLTPLQRFLDTTFLGGVAASILGPVFLLAPIALLAIWSQVGRRLLLAAAVTGVVCGINIQTRYLLPAVPFIALAMGLALMRIPGVAPAVIVLQAVLCWPTVIKSYSDGGLRVRHFLPRQALRLESEDSTLSFRLPGYRTAKMIDRLVPPDGRVFCFASPPEAYTSRELLIYYESTFNATAMDILAVASVPDLQPSWRFSFDMKPQTLRAIRIVQVKQDPGNQWSAAEVRIFLGTTELVRSPEWKLEAQPNLFEVADAFDRNPVTRWRSLQPLSPGMHLGAAFGTPQLVDRVDIDSSPDQYGIALRLDGQDPSGIWRTLSTDAHKSLIPVSPDLRRAATLELKRRSITHLVIGSTFPGAADMAANPQAWGLRFLGEADENRLYALDLE